MARIRIRIKHGWPKEKTQQKTLLETLAKNDIYVTRIITIDDGYIVLTHSDDDMDRIFQTECQAALNVRGFIPTMPPELKAKRSIILFRVDDIIYNNEEDEIKEEIERRNGWAKEGVESVYKFPRSHTMKVTFHQTKTALKAAEAGLLMFSMKIPHYTIKQEEYTPLTTCM